VLTLNLLKYASLVSKKVLAILPRQQYLQMFLKFFISLAYSREQYHLGFSLFGKFRLVL